MHIPRACVTSWKKNMFLEKLILSGYKMKVCNIVEHSIRRGNNKCKKRKCKWDIGPGNTICITYFSPILSLLNLCFSLFPCTAFNLKRMTQNIFLEKLPLNKSYIIKPKLKIRMITHRLLQQRSLRNYCFILSCWEWTKWREKFHGQWWYKQK